VIHYKSYPYHTTASEGGVTFVELLVTITVLVVITVLAAPSFTNLLMNNRILGQRDALVNALNFARSTALTQNTNVKVCPWSASGSTTCGSNWSAGWIVATMPSSGTSVLLQAHQTGPNDPNISSAAISGVSASSVIFDSRGLATTQANFVLCDERGGSYARSISVLPTGFVQTTSSAGVAAWDGGALSCT
jgi:type IV fimbrial biogenesis protein FimT